MTDETKIETKKTPVLERVPPGDRWTSIVYDMDGVDIFESLTDALEWHFQQSGQTEYFISAREGIVFVTEEKEIVVPKKITKYSLYGER